MKLGFVGLGKMGGRIVRKLLADGHELTVWNRSPQPIEELYKQLSSDEKKQFKSVETLGELAHALHGKRIIWSMLPAGSATEEVMQALLTFLDKEDIVIDGGNANWEDSERRAKAFSEKHIRFLGIGVSGGILAAENGFPLMVGGDKSAYKEIEPILKSLSKPHGGYDYFGTGGAGHFVKMVHNGIEYGMMQAIGEGFGVLEKAPFTFELDKIAHIWQKETIISSFLIDRAADALDKNATLSDIAGEIDESGEAQWTIDAAKKEKVPVTVIEDSLVFRQKSQKDATIKNSFAAKMVAALRREFGGHKVTKK